MEGNPLTDFPMKRLKQVLMNLVSMPLNLRRREERHLTVEETAATDLQAVYLFKVTDTGIWHQGRGFRAYL